MPVLSRVTALRISDWYFRITLESVEGVESGLRARGALSNHFYRGLMLSMGVDAETCRCYEGAAWARFGELLNAEGAKRRLRSHRGGFKYCKCVGSALNDTALSNVDHEYLLASQRSSSASSDIPYGCGDHAAI